MDLTIILLIAGYFVTALLLIALVIAVVWVVKNGRSGHRGTA